MSHFEDALQSFAQALEIARATGECVVEGRALGNHANALRVLTRFDQAEEEFSRALEIATDAADDLNAGIVRANRALMWIATGRLDDAENELQSILDAAGGRSLPYVRMSLGLVAEARGDFAEAQVRRARALSATEAAGEFSTSADLVLLGARLDARAGRFAEAAEAARDALRDAERAGSPLIATEAGNSLAEVIVLRASAEAVDAAPLGEAERLAGGAAETAEAVGDRAEIARSRSICSVIARMRDDKDVADALAADARRIYREIGHRLGGTDLSTAVV
jgi:tetratricopeptide (TPR) repeat protein